MFHVYLIENKISHKKYVGMTSRDTATRFKEHCGKRKTKISNAIHKYGKNLFSITTIASYNNHSSAIYNELKNILKLSTVAPNGYNVRCDGKAAQFIRAAVSGQLSFL